jgi:two-component system, NtrC family, response regulator
MTETDEKPCLLVVEDDPGLQKQLRWCLDDYQLVTVEDRAAAMNAVRRHQPAVVLQDLGLPPDPEGVSEGMATLGEILSLAPRTKVIVVTGNHDRDNALKAVGAGAYDFYPKPLDVEVLKLIVGRAFRIHALERELEELRDAQAPTPLEGIIGSDPGMQKLARTIEKVAPADVSVLILGESGTGKELIARALHSLSPRRSKRFMAINCAAIPEQLLESELFGYEKGAFTGAARTTPGKVEVAEGGTLFLDEIGDMPASLQAKVLRFLQQKVIERVGGREEIPVDVRVVCATNQDLEGLISSQRFRQDLYYRINEITLKVPPLRARGGDVVVLAHAFLRRHSADVGRGKRGFSADAVAAIAAHAWPGNVRELENKLKSALIVAEGPLITATDLGLATGADGALPLSIKDARSRAELQVLRQSLQASAGNLSMAAELLGITRPTLYDLMAKFGISTAGDGTETAPARHES